MQCFSPTSGALRKLILVMPPYFDPNRRDMFSGCFFHIASVWSRPPGPTLSLEYSLAELDQVASHFTRINLWFSLVIMINIAFWHVGHPHYLQTGRKTMHGERERKYLLIIQGLGRPRLKGENNEFIHSSQPRWLGSFRPGVCTDHY